MKVSKRGLLFTTVLILVLAPVVFTIAKSFATYSTDSTQLEYLSIGFNFQQYFKLLYHSTVFSSRLINSLMLTITTVMLGTLISLIVSYALAYHFKRLRTYFFPLIVILALIPSQIALHPQYWIMSSLNLTGHLWSLVIVNSINPLIIILTTILMIRAEGSSIEAAKIDGASDFIILSHIIVPTNKFFLSLIMSFYFIDVWNQVEQPLLFLNDFSNYPLSILLFNIVKQVPNEAYAASTLYMIPTIMLFIFGIEFFIKEESDKNEI